MGTKVRFALYTFAQHKLGSARTHAYQSSTHFMNATIGLISALLT